MDFTIDYPRLSVRDVREGAGGIQSVRGILPATAGCRDVKKGLSH